MLKLAKLLVSLLNSFAVVLQGGRLELAQSHDE
jgi:hypothetical protein